MRLALFLELLSNNTHAIYRARQLKSSYPFLIDLNRKIELQSRDQQRRRAAPTSSEPAVGGLMTDSATRIPSRPSSRGQRTDSDADSPSRQLSACGDPPASRGNRPSPCPNPTKSHT